MACRELVRPESHALCTPLCHNPHVPGPIERFWAPLSLAFRFLSTRSGDTCCEKHHFDGWRRNRKFRDFTNTIVSQAKFDEHFLCRLLTLIQQTQFYFISDIAVITRLHHRSVSQLGLCSVHNAARPPCPAGLVLV